MTALLQTSVDLGIVNRTTENNPFLDVTINSVEGNESHNPDPVSNDVSEMFRVVLFVFICGFLSLFGVGANVTNIIVFIRQGFKDSINISLLGLALGDLGCALTMVWVSVGFSPLLESPELNFNSADVVYMTGCWPHACFNRVTSLITAFITLERCLCITIPLKVKEIITPFRTKLIILFIFMVVISLFTPFYFVNCLVWVLNPLLNTTMLTLAYAENRVEVETIIFPIHSVILPIVCLLSVIIFTSILIFGLNKKQKWRQTSISLTAEKLETISTKERKVVKMVILISIIFISCYTPAIINFFVMVYNPEFSFTGKYVNVYMVVWSLTALVQTVNFSVNIFVYYAMSSKFKITLLQTLCRRQ